MTKTMALDPFIIMGPPRAGSTFLCHVLNAHPEILCTDEARPFLAAARALKPLNARQDYGQRWERIFVPSLRNDIVTFYDELTPEAAPEHVVWGDKFPHYCDPTWAPRILESIDRLFPNTKYIFLTRNRKAVTASMKEVNKSHQWLKHSPGDIYDSIHRRGDEWERKIGDRFLRVDHDDGIKKNVSKILPFLGLSMAEELRTKIHQEVDRPTRYSTPTSW